MPRPPRIPRASVGTAVVLIAVGAILAFAVDVPEQVHRYVDVLDLGLILVWSGILLLGMQAYLYRPRRPRRAPHADRTDQWYEHDVHRPGYAGETRRLPTVRDR